MSKNVSVNSNFSVFFFGQNSQNFNNGDEAAGTGNVDAVAPTPIEPTGASSAQEPIVQSRAAAPKPNKPMEPTAQDSSEPRTRTLTVISSEK